MPARLATLAALSAIALAACTAAEHATEPLAAPAFAIQPTDFCDGVAMTAPECGALVALYNSTDGDNWTDNTNWGVNPDPCTWFGVTCGDNIVVSDRPYVHFLSLEDNGLSGAIPADLGQLAFASTIRLSGNALTGTIPAGLGSASALLQLHLQFNQLTGPIPAELGGLERLQVLHLSHNLLSGSVPAQLADASDLVGVDLSFNQLSGSIPAELGAIEGLNALRLRSNQLSGVIPPDLGNATNLQVLSLQENLLSGPIPAELGSLTELDNLHLYDNRLSGLVPLPVAILGDPMLSCGIHLNNGLFMPDVEAYRDADQDGDGSICGLELASAEDIGEDAVDTIDDLVPDPLNGGQANALSSKIENAVAKAAKGNYQAAINQMQTFINQLEDMVGNGTLMPAEAAPLLAQAQFLIDIWAEEL